MKENMGGSFSRSILNLIIEPHFVRYENLLAEPNFFTIVGRSHYERWHTAFWGWLLDANGSHLLGDYALRRLLALLADERCLKSSLHSEDFLLATVPLVAFSDVQVSPNEYLPVETMVRSVGRFDIFVSFSYLGRTSAPAKANLLIELKIDSKPDGEQAKRYANWLLEQHPEDTNLLIYLTPQLVRDPRTTVGDERWYCLDYQLLNDKLLLPLLDHPRLNDKVKPFNGRPFFYPMQYQGYTLESHYARDRATRVLTDLCDKLELQFETVET